MGLVSEEACAALSGLLSTGGTLIFIEFPSIIAGTRQLTGADMLHSLFEKFRYRYSKSPDSSVCVEVGCEKPTKDHWGERAKEVEAQATPIAWTDSPLVNSMYIHPIISGNPNKNWLEYVSENYFPAPVEKALSLGCGGGGLERHAVAMNMARHFDAFDASEGAIVLARELASNMKISKRINYQVADVNRLSLPSKHYDTVYASQSLHHIAELEHCLDQIVQALRPGGFFITNEFIGPTQYQWTETQVRLAQELLNELPEEYRIGIQSKQLKENIARPTVDQMNEIDPTEAIRSAEIVEKIEERFRIIERIDFGGTLLQLVLDDITGNFTDSELSRSLLRTMMDREQQLLREGVIDSDFTLIIAQPS